jgi:uncharacterized protein YpiB (UPF0302 family)
MAYRARTDLERATVFLDRSLTKLSKEELYQALDTALSEEESALVWQLIDEIERRDRLAEF